MEVVDAPEVYEVVFERVGDDGVSRLWRSALEDGAEARLVGDGIEAHGAAPHPDGRRIAFGAPDPTAPDDSFVLFLLTAEDTPPVRLSPDLAAVELELDFAPDGAHVAFTSQREDLGGDIVVARLVDDALVDVTNLTPPAVTPGPDRTPAWAPDGRRLAFTSYRDGGPAIWVMDADGANARRVTTPGDHGDYFPRWSPDQRTLAFQRNDGDGAGGTRTRIGLVPADGSAGPTFLALGGNAYAPRFTPDGAHLVVGARLDDAGDVYVLTTAGERVLRSAPTASIAARR